MDKLIKYDDVKRILDVLEKNLIRLKRQDGSEPYKNGINEGLQIAIDAVIEAKEQLNSVNIPDKCTYCKQYFEIHELVADPHGDLICEKCIDEHYRH